MPCMDCARGIVQVGIKQVIISSEEQIKWAKKDKWIEHSKRTVQLFKEAKVILVVYTTPENLNVNVNTKHMIAEYESWERNQRLNVVL